MKYVLMGCGISFLVLCGAAGCALRRAPMVIPEIASPVQQIEYIKPVVEKSCEDEAWSFDPEKNVPDFGDTCAWNVTSTHIPWVYYFSHPSSKRNIPLEIGCMRRYQHRYANVIGAEFYVFCRTDAGPDILGWGLKDSEILGWVAVVDENMSWIPLGWNPKMDIEADIGEKPPQIRWARFLFQYKDGMVFRMFLK